MSVPPIHPALVHLPIAFVIFSFLTDAFAKVTLRESLRHAAWWSMVAALLTGIMTIAAGYWDMNRAALTADTHGYVDQHLVIGWILAGCLIVLTIWRWRIRQQARRVVTGGYLAAAFIVLAITLFQGWYGGEMVFSHGAGVAAAGQGTESAEVAPARLAHVRDALAPIETAMGRPAHGGAAEHGHGQSGKPPPEPK